jgi:hypothetical protein
MVQTGRLYYREGLYFSIIPKGGGALFFKALFFLSKYKIEKNKILLCHK